MISFPNAKINLGLNILSKREDGYHNISSCFYPVPWCDILEIIPSIDLKFTSSGIDIPGDKSNNLCIQAYNLFNKDFNIPGVHIHLHKIIPIGAGLGGGSSDCAFTLKMLNNLFQLNLSDDRLESYAGKLGSDCPFFIRNKPTLVSGTGDQFKPISLNLSGNTMVLVYPKIHISTREAYAGIKPMLPKQSITEIIDLPISKWKSLLTNDFENSLYKTHPDIKNIRQLLYEHGAVYASMTGSGSTVFGIFTNNVAGNLLDILSKKYIVWSKQL
ncbi:4-(cytidine 5'-diphospho)-2-C-methyl-D-erythritol kinase [Reichenbachiella sp. MALMAid0571]|uniref:4-(cytidine 5'-diphospho)-2-C-methyl-D-erythritol kinase n=1 Tax=Reichenbachiella sp. MALMAid0571 TaxID=3143939 RepID=UPI0032E056F1